MRQLLMTALLLSGACGGIANKPADANDFVAGADGGTAPVIDAGTEDAAPPIQAIVTPKLAVSTEYPILINKSGTILFPTYLAHLLGIPGIVHPIEFHTVCTTMTLTGAASRTFTLEVRFPGYAAAATQNVALVGNVPKRVCADPVYDLTSLYALTAGTAGRIEVSFTEVSGNPLINQTQAVTIMPGNDVLWSRASATNTPSPEMVDLSVVYATPHDPAIESLLTAVQARSHFQPAGFGLGPYARAPYSRLTNVAVGQARFDMIVFEASETAMTWDLSSVTGGTDQNIDVYLFTEAQYQAWTAGTGNLAVAVWPSQVTGSHGSTAVPAAGQYRLVLYNPTNNLVSRDVQWTRSVTREDVARDALRSIFEELQSRGIDYASVTSSYFTGAQHIKRPSEVLTTLSANCIDGSLLFASVLELIGMQPVVITKTGHAYVGVRSAPGSTVAWPIETTMVATNTFSDAYQAAMNNLAQDQVSDPLFHIVDVTTLRAQKLTPRPE